MKGICLFLGLVVMGTCGLHQSKTLPSGTLITAENANQVTGFENTPESVLMYFYASRIRKDNAWEKVCLPEQQRSDYMKRQLEKYAGWNITKYQYVSKKEFEPGKFWVNLYMEIIFNGRADDGHDEATVEKIDGRWVITDIPI
jgi:hypothetical protein